MGTFLNPDNRIFRDLASSPVYVDKSGIIAWLNSKIYSGDKYICVTRPEGFGKTVTADMLVAYYGKGRNSRGIFDRLKISSEPTYKKHKNRYNVIRVDMSCILKDYDKNDSVDEIISGLKKSIVSELRKKYPLISYGKTFSTYLERIYSKKHIGFVFVIDEWDAILRYREDDVSRQGEYLDFLASVLKDKNYIALAYMTGIFPVINYGDESGANMFMNFSMTNAAPLQKYTGFTENEVKELSSKNVRQYTEFEYWYNGYTVNGVSVYNPKSVVESLSRGVSDNYWAGTQKFESLQRCIGANIPGVREAIDCLLAGSAIKIDSSMLKIDISTITHRDELLTLLIHLGYLTYDFDTKTVRIPNHEVYCQFVAIIGGMGWDDTVSKTEQTE